MLVFTPPHVTGMPAVGSPGAARENECKARITQLAQSRGVAVVDFRVASPITREARNYWDKLHYRWGSPSASSPTSDARSAKGAMIRRGLEAAGRRGGHRIARAVGIDRPGGNAALACYPAPALEGDE